MKKQTEDGVVEGDHHGSGLPQLCHLCQDVSAEAGPLGIACRLHEAPGSSGASARIKSKRNKCKRNKGKRYEICSTVRMVDGKSLQIKRRERINQNYEGVRPKIPVTFP